MTLPKDTVKPKTNFTHPSERPYWDESTGTLAAGVVADTAKSGADYGVQDPQVREAIGGTGSETGNGAGTP
jgi:hypothetical protein